MSPNLEEKHHHPQLQIVHMVIRLMRLQLPQSVSDHMTLLHQYCTQTCDLSITVYHNVLNTLWQVQNRCLIQSLSQGFKSSLLLRLSMKCDSLLC